ncbi:MAG: phospho-N-acetylmuramoyl-pentapeptide-transferase, partial [Flavobacteriales bacterium]|nr:phospho-N-acetylmuramoyl-pentapeptide-transferase [Flavobacteriales bacterium]
MLYHLFTTLREIYDLPGAGLFSYVSFRAGMSLMTSLLVGILFGKRIIERLQLKQVGEIVRDLGLEGQMNKQGTPTMGGLIILGAILVPTLLFADLTNVYTQLMILATVWLGTIGFIDDYIKVFKKNKEGLAGRFKVIGQVGMGVILGAAMIWHPDIAIKELAADDTWTTVRSTATTIPFIKDNHFDYAWLLSWLVDDAAQYVWIVFIPLVILIVTAVSNGANLTDGIDGLATGTSAIVGMALAVLAYVSSNTVIANYLSIMYIPGSE